MDYLHVNVSSTGEMVLPESLRRSLHIEEGGVALVRQEGGMLIVDTAESRVAKARAILHRFIPPGTTVVDEFIAERRADAERE